MHNYIIQKIFGYQHHESWSRDEYTHQTINWGTFTNMLNKNVHIFVIKLNKL